MNKKTRWILWVVILCVSLSWVTPVAAQAAQDDPLVLLEKKEGSTEYRYRYDEYGNCVYEEIVCGTRTEKTYYTYSTNGSLAEEFYYINDVLSFCRFYDNFGNKVEEWNYDSSGNVRIFRSVPEYDEYGRLTWYTETGPYRDNDKLVNPYNVASERYEYYTAPETLLFGHYEQDGNTRNGPEPIEWEILDTDGETMLLISKYALDSRAYHSKNTAVSWKDSDLRSWLNGEFLETAFTASERNQIRNTRQETNVNDWAFVLSLEEVKQYFPSDEARLCLATRYAANRGAYVNQRTGGSWWLLRTPGTGKNAVVSINSDGTIDRQGGSVNSLRGTVRPSIRVDLTAMKGNEKPSRVHRSYTSYSSGKTEGQSIFSSLFTYNDEGLLTYEQWYFPYASDVYDYEYDDHGNLTRKVSYSDFQEGNSVTITYYDNSYNYAGLLTKQIITIDGEEEEQVIEYRYNSAGQMISKTTRIAGDTTAETWEYDRYGNLLRYRENGNMQQECTYAPLSQALWE